MNRFHCSKCNSMMKHKFSLQIVRNWQLQKSKWEEWFFSSNFSEMIRDVNSHSSKMLRTFTRILFSLPVFYQFEFKNHLCFTAQANWVLVFFWRFSIELDRSDPVKLYLVIYSVNAHVPNNTLRCIVHCINGMWIELENGRPVQLQNTTVSSDGHMSNEQQQQRQQWQ